MPRRKKVPAYCHHKATDQAYVTINGRERYLGRFGSPESREKYARIIGTSFDSLNETASRSSKPRSLTVADLILRYWTGHVVGFYVRDGKPTGVVRGDGCER